MIFHNFQESGTDPIMVFRGHVYSHNNKIWISLVDMTDTQTPINMLGREFIPWTEPGTDPTAWQEVPKDCDNCYCKAMTVKTSGSTPDEEVTSCPYAVAHEAATQQAVPDACQAWDPIEWPQLPPTPEPQLLRQAQNTNVHDDIDALFSGDAIDEKKQALRQRLRSGRIGRAEMQEILAKLI